MRINFFNRNDKAGFSIKNVFSAIQEKMILVEYENYYLPFIKLSISNLLFNITYTYRNRIKNGVNHISGDVHYVAMGLIGCKSILTIHDVDSILKGNVFKRFFFKFFWFWLPSLCVDRITVISNFTKNQVLKVLPWAKNKINVVYNPINSSFKTVKKQFNYNEPVILHIGTKKNKNLINTVMALEGLNVKLIIVGKLNNEQLDVLNKCKVSYENYINISNKDIVELYVRCDIVSFISLYEGFGMPIIEGQKTGRVIITSKRASIPEIAENSVYYVNPDDVYDMNKGFIEIIENEKLREDLINKGFNNIKRFEPKKISNDYLKIYEGI